MPPDPTAANPLEPRKPTGSGVATAGLSFLTRVAGHLSASSEPGALGGALDEVAKLISGHAWMLWRDTEQDEARWLPSGSPGPIPSRLAAQEGSLLRAALSQGRPAVIHDPARAGSLPERTHLVKAGGSWAFLPLEIDARPVGCLVLRAEGSLWLSEESLGLVRGAMPMIGLFLRASQLQRELEARVEERTQEISLLYDVSRSLGFVLSPEDLFHLVGSSLHRALPFDICSIMLLLPDHRELSVQLASPAQERAVRAFSRLARVEVERISGKKVGRIPVTVARLRQADGEAAERGSDLQSVAHAPLYVRGEVLGLLSVASREPDAFGEGAMRLVYTIANQASLTLDRMRTAREAEASKIHSMLVSMADGVVLLDRGLRIVMSNPAAQAHLSVLAGSSSPRSLARLGEVPLEPLLSTLARPESRPRSFEVHAPAEGKVFSVTCSPVRGLSESANGLVVVISDVTEARVLQLQMAQNEKLSALGEMISGVAHELNNPLGSVMGYAQLLQAQEVDDKTRRKIAAIDAEATRCRKIVQALLGFVRPPKSERRLLRINAALDSVLQILRHQLVVDDVTVTEDLDGELRLVTGDYHLLQQVFLNIIHNAYQALKERGGPGSLTVRSRNAGDRVIVEITDDGPGISPENLKRVFIPFFTTKEAGVGTGLGLSLAYSTVRGHGGTITAHSEPGSGATFLVDLPAASQQAVDQDTEGPYPPEDVPEASQAANAALRRAGEGPAQATGRRILVVEDETALAEVMVEALRFHGHEVETAGDGRTARSKISERRYDLIITDLKMPHMNGRDFYRHVASVEPALARRIIFSTGDTASPETQAFFEEVGNSYLSKPFNLAELLRVVDSVLDAN